MEIDPPNFESKEFRTIASENAKAILLGEFTYWSEANNHTIYLLNESVCEDGRFCLELSMEDEKHFSLYCPSDYPNSNEDNFFVEADQSLQFWCNALNEFILDSETSLMLPIVLNKAVALYLTKRKKSPCVSSSGSDSGDGEFCDEFMTIEGEEWDEKVCQLRKRWRVKEAQIRASTNKPKTSDMFDGTVKDHPKQVFSNSAASGILTNDLVAILHSQKTTGINAEAIDDNIYKWSVFLSAFESHTDLQHDLRHLKEKYGYDYIELHLNFTMDLHPFYPPIVKVIRPRLLGTTMMQVSSMDMLKLSHWNAARDMKSILMEIKEYLGNSARLDINSERNDRRRYPQGAYIDIENHLLCLAWVSEISTRAHVQLPKNDQDIKQPRKQSNANKLNKAMKGEPVKAIIFPAGTGYSSALTNHKRWDINAHLAAQKEKDKQIEQVLQKILYELCSNVQSKNTNKQDATYSSFSLGLPSCSTASQHCSSENISDNNDSPVDPTDDLFNILEASSLVPFLEMKLQVDSFLEISQHRSVYRCIVDILSELAVHPKLVHILWNLPNQAQSLYTLVSKVDIGASTLLERIGKVSSNGTVPKSGDKKVRTSTSTMSCLTSKPEPEEEEKLARDFHNMSLAITEALTKYGFLSMNTSTPMEVSTSTSVVDTSEVNGTDQSLATIYKNALKDMQFLSCDIEVDGPASHHFANKFKKANPPSAKQLMRIAQEMATLSTSLPLDLGSSIFIRTDDAKCTLLRALIIGPESTPYSSGCFVFDIYFPPMFPTVPPNVHLCTTGLGVVRFNPNLYANGTVCLSLLGTWKGMAGETWNSVASTLLQVLVSIQSLILVPEPYFNEPGFEASLGTEKGRSLSMQYNLETMTNTVKHAMIAHIERPASGFQDVIHTHFKIKGKRILEEVKEFIATNSSRELVKTYGKLEAQLNKLMASQ